MQFKFYEKLPRLNEALIRRFSHHIRATDVDWHVTELVDGDHMALYADANAKDFKIATRHRMLDDFDSYSCAYEVVQLHKDWVMELSSKEKAPIVVYGVATGGIYDSVSKGVPIKTVCEYSKYNEFVVHDIKVGNSFISQFQLETLSSTALIMTAPVLYSGKYKHSCGYPENNLSAIPFISPTPMPVKFDNEMKGIVIRPVYELHNGTERLIMKKLNRKYVGAVFGKPKDKDKPKVELNDTLVEIAAHMDNEAIKIKILDAVLNAVGEFTYRDIDRIAGKYVLTLLDKVVYVKYNLLTRQEQHLVHKELNKIATDKISQLLRIGDAA